MHLFKTLKKDKRTVPLPPPLPPKNPSLAPRKVKLELGNKKDTPLDGGGRGINRIPFDVSSDVSYCYYIINYTQSQDTLLYQNREIFRNAQYLYSTPDYDGDPNVYRWNYFYTPVQIGDDVVGVRIALRDMVPGVEGKMDSQIYNWGIKRGTTLDGGGPG